MTTCRAALHNMLVTIIRDYKKNKGDSEIMEISRSIESSMRRVKGNLSNPPSVRQLANEVGISEAGFRIDEAQRLMTLGNANIKEISYDLGFSSRQYFSTVFKRVTGVSPGEFITKLSG